MHFPNQSPNANMFETNTKAVLYLFAPNMYNPISNQALRPLMYNVTDQFANKASEVAARAVTGSSGSLLTHLMTSPEAQGIVMPVASPVSLINMGHVSQMWRFMLLINDSGRSNGGVSPFSPLSEQRTIRYGYFDQEPWSPYTNHINYNAILTFTHKTVIETITPMGMHNNASKRISTRLDDSFIQPATSIISSDPDLYLTGPMESFEAISYGDNGDSWVAPASTVSSLRSLGGPKSVDTVLYQPLHNLRHVASNVIRTLNDYSNQQATSIYGTDIRGAPSIGDPTLNEMLRTNMQSRRTAYSNLGPDENEVWPMQRLMQTYNPEIAPVDIQQSTMFSAVDQFSESATNVFSSLLCAVVPSIMANLCISELSFRYRMVRELRQYMRDDEFFLQGVSTTVPFSGDEVNERVNKVMSQTRHAVFDMMYETHGDFELTASFNCVGLSHVILNFNSDSRIADSVYESPTMLDGLISPLVGNAKVCGHNADQIDRLLRDMMETQRTDKSSLVTDLTSY